MTSPSPGAAGEASGNNKRILDIGEGGSRTPLRSLISLCRLAAREKLRGGRRVTLQTGRSARPHYRQPDLHDIHWRVRRTARQSGLLLIP